MRIAVIGPGSHARRNVLPAIRRTAGITLAAVAGRSEAATRAMAEEFGCDAIIGLDELWRRDDLDAVWVCTSNDSHAALVRPALAQGWHVLCEKPLTPTLEATVGLLDDAARHGRALREAFVYVHHTQHAALATEVAEGTLGDLRQLTAAFGFPPPGAGNIRFRPECAGGALLDAGVYGVHWSRQLLGATPAVAGARLTLGPTGVDVGGAALLDFGAGRLAVVSFGFDQVYRNRVEVWGTRGHATLTRAFSIPPDVPPALFIERQGSSEERQLAACDHFSVQLQAFAAGAGNPDSRSRWREDARAQATVVDAIQRAAGRPV